MVGRIMSQRSRLKPNAKCYGQPCAKLKVDACHNKWQHLNNAPYLLEHHAMTHGFSKDEDAPHEEKLGGVNST